MSLSGSVGQVSFTDKHVGTFNTVTLDLGGLSLTGADAGNNHIAGTTTEQTVNISAGVLVVHGAMDWDKVYDGTTATPETVTGQIVGDAPVRGGVIVVSAPHGTYNLVGNYESTAEGSGITPTITGLTLAGATSPDHAYIGGVGATPAPPPEVAFGLAFSLNQQGADLAVGSIPGTDTTAGAVHLFTFSDTSFGGGSHAGSIGQPYAGQGDAESSADNSDPFGVSVSLPGTTTSFLAVGDPDVEGKVTLAAYQVTKSEDGNSVAIAPITLTPATLSAMVLGLSDAGGAVPALRAHLGAGSPEAARLLGALSATLPDVGALNRAVHELTPDASGASLHGARAAQQSLFAALDKRAEVVREGVRLAMAGSTPVYMDDTSRRFWLQGLAGMASQDTRKGADGFRLDNQGLALGVEWDLHALAMAGLTLGYTQADVDGRDGAAGDGVEVDSTHVGGYYSRTLAHYTLDASLVASINRHHSLRLVAVPGAQELESADYDGYQITARIEAGLPWRLETSGQFRWLLGARFGHLHADGYSERGGVGAQQVASQNAQTLQSLLGVEFTQRLSKQAGYLLRARYLHEFADAPATHVSFVDTGASFTVDAVQPGRDALQIGLGYRRGSPGEGTLTLAYDVEVRDRYLAQQLAAKMSWSF